MATPQRDFVLDAKFMGLIDEQAMGRLVRFAGIYESKEFWRQTCKDAERKLGATRRRLSRRNAELRRLRCGKG